jgi:predicted RecA/RadA family phage recombinase
MVPHTAAADIAAGDVVVTDETPRVAHGEILTGALGSLAAEGGVYQMTGAGEYRIDVPVYWDASASKVTTDDNNGDNKLFGFTISACAGDGSPVDVRHEPQALPAS